MKNTYPELKLLLISPVVPPSPTGQSIVIQRLLQTWPEDKYCLLATSTPEKDDAKANSKTGIFYKIKKSFGLIFKFPKLLFQLLHLIKNQSISVIICCTGDPIALPAAAFASWLTKKELYFYVFDDYIHQWPNLYFRKIATIIETICIKQSTKVITTNEFLTTIYQKRHHIKPYIIHNSLDAQTIVNKPRALPSYQNSPIKMIYTGSIYYAHVDAFLNLVTFMQQSSRPIELHIYTPQDPAQLQAKGIRHDRIYYHDYLEHNQVSQALEQADLLFLPLSFNKQYEALINTSAPGKFGEYLASGTPILAHIPTDSFVNWYCKKHDCAVVIDEISVDTFAKAFDRICTDSEYLQKISQNALNRANIDFDHASIDQKFRHIFCNGYPNELA